MPHHLPRWAVQRVVAALESRAPAGRHPQHLAELARSTGMSKSLTRQCLRHVERARDQEAGLAR
ncbi:hypothetical protein OKJ48_10050 [Streptomyces kunmingensis]|uniref:Uncharacterized protein n=1 Tax=Streptomyces kunmingensis TaxID=68225 RepID=A0ABU6C7K5_9ACTN|nr:hypothetical protein [Streptomyces kunmingensis]MEB3960582.1 hypothetical protein [Streptomyces kunmingensis]